MSPGSQGITREWNATRYGGGKVMFATVFSACTSPLSTVETFSFSTSGISSGITSTGPKLKNVSKLLQRVR